MGNDDDQLVREVAADHVVMLGRRAVDHLLDRAEMAHGTGDVRSAVTRWENAITAAELLY